MTNCFIAFCSKVVLEGFKEEGVDADALLDRYIQVYKDCLRDRPTDLHVGVHLCRGETLYLALFDSVC